MVGEVMARTSDTQPPGRPRALSERNVTHSLEVLQKELDSAIASLDAHLNRMAITEAVVDYGTAVELAYAMRLMAIQHHDATVTRDVSLSSDSQVKRAFRRLSKAIDRATGS
jgi:hypothetical protein